MPNLKIEELSELMASRSHIRNIAIVASVDHGLSTLTDELICAGGIIIREKNVRYSSTKYDENERQFTLVKPGNISLYYEQNNQKYLINVLQTPRKDFSGDLDTTLRIVDGVLVVMDCVESSHIGSQGKIALRKALQERIPPLLMVNKLDRVILELELEPEAAYQLLSSCITSANDFISTYCDPVGDVMLQPEKGNVIFGSGLHGWGFTLSTFAKLYTKKFGVSEEKLIKNFWGNNYFDVDSKKWVEKSTSDTGTILKRGFCQFILSPIYQICNAVLNDQKEKLDKMLSALNIALTRDDKEEQGKKLLKIVLRHFLPVAQNVMEVVVLHVPSPIQAQAHRYENLYTERTDDVYAQGIKNCDPSAPLMIYVTKMIFTSDQQLFGLGRVFSGVVRNGQKVRIMGTNYEPGKNDDLFVKPIHTLFFCLRYYEPVDYEIPCGNIIGLAGLRNYLIKSGTLTDENAVDACPLKTMKLSTSPVMRVTIEPTNAAELHRLTSALTTLCKCDPIAHAVFDENMGKHVLSGSGESHLEHCLKELQDDLHYTTLNISEPFVCYKETVTTVSKTCDTEFNQLHMSAEPLDDGLVCDIEKGRISSTDNSTIIRNKIVKRYKWDEAQNIWSFGPNENGPNVLVDCTNNSENLNGIKDHIKHVFQWDSKEGALCNENLRGVRFNITDFVRHTHRGTPYNIQAFRRCFQKAQLLAEPRLMEPIYFVEIVTQEITLGAIYSLLNQKRGTIIATDQRIASTSCTIKCYLPVSESMGFEAMLYSATQGQACCSQCVFDHWDVMIGSPYEEGNVRDIITNLRKLKGLPEEIPSL
jgi:elongation factor 2